MKTTSLCYIEKDGAYLMLHRIKKTNDENHDKWVGIGGKLEYGESPYDAARREVTEETGLTLNSLSYRGIITFVSNLYGTEHMHLFTSESFSGEIVKSCDEGVLEWVKKDDVKNLPIWEGDKIFLDLISKDTPFFSLKLIYENDSLIDHVIEI